MVSEILKLYKEKRIKDNTDFNLSDILFLVIEKQPDIANKVEGSFAIIPTLPNKEEMTVKDLNTDTVYTCDNPSSLSWDNIYMDLCLNIAQSYDGTLKSTNIKAIGYEALKFRYPKIANEYVTNFYYRNSNLYNDIIVKRKDVVKLSEYIAEYQENLMNERFNSYKDEEKNI